MEKYLFSLLAVACALFYAPTVNAVGTAPFTLTAKQQMDEKNRYKFNVELNATLVDGIIDKTVDAENGKTVKDIMTYIIVVDDATKTRLQKATSIDVGRNNYYNGHSYFNNFWTESTGNNAQARLGENQYVPSGLWFHRFDQSELPSTSEMPALVWHNIYPTVAEKGKLCTYDYNSYTEITDTDYNFTAYLTCADKWDENTIYFPQWDLLEFQPDEASTKLVAPVTAISLGTPYLQKSDFKKEYYTFPAIKQPDGGRLSNLYKEDVTDWIPDPADPDSWKYIEVVTNYAGDHNETEGPKDDDPVYLDYYNESVAPITIDPLNVADEVLENWSVQYDISIIPAGGTFDPTKIDSRHKASLIGNWTQEAGKIDPQVENKINVYDLDLSSLKTMKSLDGRHTDYIDGRSSQISFEARLCLSYSRKSGGDYSSNTYYLDNEPKTNTLTINFPSPTATQRERVAFSKYKAQYYDEPVKGQGGTLQTLDYLAHAVVGFDINGYSGIDLYPYIAFDAQQKLFYCDKHFGVYREPHNETSHPGCQIEGDHDPLNTDDPGNWWKLSFAGTRAANGGHPVGSLWDSSVTDIVPALRCPADDYGEAIDYVDFKEYIDGSSTSKEEPRFNWSRIAARSGYLPIHINPVKRYSAESFETDNTLNGAPEITAKFAVLFPLVTTIGYDSTNLMPVAKVTDESMTRAADGRVSPIRDYYFNIGDIDMIALPAETKIDLSDSQITGVEEIVVDHTNFSDETEYYNLQGIRVAHPANGQIYIVRQGGKTMKVLY